MRAQWRRLNSNRIVILGGLVACAMMPASVQSQERNGTAPATSILLPNFRHFPSPAGDPIEPRFAIGLAVTNLFETRGPERPAFAVAPASGTEVQASAAIGGTIPLLQLVGGRVVVAAQAGVFARFRIERPSRDDLGQDWVVGVPIEVAWSRMSARIRIVHRSSHLGDEFTEATGARRIEMGGESIDGLFAYRVSGIRLYGGGGWIFHSNTDNTDVLVRRGRLDRFTVQAGADTEMRPFGDPRLSLVAGADWQSAERTAWRGTLGFAGALRVQMGTREARLAARYAGGNSALGQFFLTPEEVWTLELVLGL
jgi:hypothetical protein